MFLLRTLLTFFKDRIYRELFITVVIMTLTGMVVFHFTEHWSWLDSLYFSISTITTTGYGDLYPKSTAGKIFNMFFLIVSLMLILLFINTMNQHFNSRRERKLQGDRHHSKLAKKFLHENHVAEEDRQSSLNNKTFRGNREDTLL